MALVLTVLVIFALLVGNEVYWRKAKTHNEFARKFIHLTVGTLVAFWPFFLSWQQIRLLSIAFIVVVAISKYAHIFRAIHSVQRPTYGELWFAAAVGLTTLITNNKWIYMTALLQMSLADGLAAIIGTRYGRANSYKIFGQHKSIAGTATFAVISLLSLMIFMYGSGTYIAPLIIAPIAIGATILENVGVYGLDNLLVPLFVASVLGLVS